MNHPTEHVEELCFLSKQAIACEDYSQAAVFLRRALELAPLRKDIRADLARVLAREELPAAGSNQSGSGSGHSANEGWSPQPLRSAVRPVPSTALATMMGGGVRAASVTPTPPGGISSRPRVSVRTEGNVNMHLDEEMMSFSEMAEELEPSLPQRAALHRLLEGEDEDEFEQEPLPAPAARKRRSRTQLVQQSASIEDCLATAFEKCITAVKQSRPSRWGYGACYVAIAVFVAVACLKTHRLFGDQKASYKVADANKSRKAVVQQSSIEPPSLFSGLEPEAPKRATEEDVLEKGRKHVAAKEYQQAISALEPAVDNANRTASLDLMRTVLAQAYDGRATQLLQQNSLAEAAKLYGQAVKLQPAATAYQLHLSNALFFQATSAGSKSTTKLQEALRLAKGVVLVEPQNSSAYQAIGQVQDALGNKSEAKSAWQRVLSMTSKGSSANKRAAEQLSLLNKGA